MSSKDLFCDLFPKQQTEKLFCKRTLLMITRAIGQQLLFTKFLIERDALSVCFTRMGSGFHPPTVIQEAKLHAKNIGNLLQEMEKISKLPKEKVVAEDYHHLMRNCCGRD